jgi:hypothetical protein
MKAQCTTGRRRICKLSGVEKQDPPTVSAGDIDEERRQLRLLFEIFD